MVPRRRLRLQQGKLALLPLATPTYKRSSAQEFGRLVETTIGQTEGAQFVSHTGIRFPQNGCLSCPHHIKRRSQLGGGLVGWFGGVGIPVAMRGVETEMALEALLAAIRIDPEEVVEQELDRAMSSCPADRHTSTVWTTGGSS
jgi:hypothetical protein